MYLIAYLFDALADLYFSIWRLHHSGADGFRFGFIRLLVRTYLRTYTKMKSLNCGNKKRLNRRSERHTVLRILPPTHSKGL